MTKREYLEDWFYKRGYWKTNIDAMDDVEITNNYCGACENCGGCPFTNDCPPLGKNEIREWIHNGNVNYVYNIDYTI